MAGEIQTLSEAGKNGNLTVRGNKRFTLAEIAAASGLKTGQPVNKEIFDQNKNETLKAP